MFNTYYEHLKAELLLHSKLLSTWESSNLAQSICWLLVRRLGTFEKRITVINPGEVEIHSCLS